MISAERMQAIMVDADEGRPRTGYTKAERDFRDTIELELAQMQARGQTLDYGAMWELPDISYVD